MMEIDCAQQTGAYDVNECDRWHRYKAAIAQLVARGSHNPKVVCLILTGRI